MASLQNKRLKTQTHIRVNWKCSVRTTTTANKYNKSTHLYVSFGVLLNVNFWYKLLYNLSKRDMETKKDREQYKKTILERLTSKTIWNEHRNEHGMANGFGFGIGNRNYKFCIKKKIPFSIVNNNFNNNSYIHPYMCLFVTTTTRLLWHLDLPIFPVPDGFIKRLTVIVIGNWSM